MRLGMLALGLATILGISISLAHPAAAVSVSERDDAAGMAAANAVTTDPALARLVPASIRQKGVLVIGAEMQQPPEDFYAANGQTSIGFEVDLARAIGRLLGLRVDYRTMAFDALITALKSGRVDATMSAMNDTKPREQAISFIDYYNAGITMLVQKGNPHHITGPDTLCGLSVSAALGTTQQAFAEAQSKQCTAAGKPPVTLVIGSSTAGQEAALRTGRVATILDDTPTALYTAQIAGNGQYFEPVNYPPINGGPYGIGVPKSDTQLRTAVQQALQKLISDGTYGKILAAWGMSAGAVKQATVDAG
jgi:polar amino acid transport system substrate-binding protein